MSLRNNFLLLLTLIYTTACSNDDLTPPNNGGGDKPTEVGVDPFDKIPSLQEMVVYEVNLRAYSATGNLAGVKNRLDHIESLGANVIWLMPIFPVGILNASNSPYAVKDYVSVNTEFGKESDLIELINEAHSRGIAVVLDWVANHTSWDHAWITNKDWYVQDANGNIIEPPGTGWTDVAELNYDNQDMRAEMITSMKYWVENAGIDGFRCDAVDFVPTDFWTQVITAVNAVSSKDLIWLAEGGISENFEAGFEFNYSWDYYTKIKSVYHDNSSASGLFTVNSQEFNAVPDGKTKLRYITNHDVYAWDETPVEVFGLEGSVGAFVATSFMGGIPLIYNGQEVGEPDLISFFGKDPINWTQNPDILSQYQKVLAIRSEWTDVLDAELVTYAHKDALIYKRTLADKELVIMVNTRNTVVTVSLAAEFQNSAWINLVNDTAIDTGSELSLGAYEYLILVRR